MSRRYEDELIDEYKLLEDKKLEIIIDIQRLISYFIKLEIIDKSMNQFNYLIRIICLNKKFNQIKRIRLKFSLKFKKLCKEYYLLNNRHVIIKSNLILYYDKKIEETIHELGIENIRSLQDLLIINNDNIKKNFDKYL